MVSQVQEAKLAVNWKGRLRRRLERIFEQRWVNVGLRAKMGLIVEIGLVGLMLIFLVLAINTARQTTQRILTERVMLARLSAATVDSTLQHTRSMLLILAGRNSLRDPEASPADRREVLQAASDQILLGENSIYLFDAQGEPLVTVGDRQPDLSGGRLVEALASPGQASSLKGVQLVLLPGIDSWVLMAAPVKDFSGNLSGWLAVALNLQDEQIVSFRSAIELGRTGTLDLVDAKGRILVSSHPVRAADYGLAEDVLGRLFVAGKPGIETCLGCSAADSSEASGEVIAFAPLTQAPWGVVFRQQADELMAPANRLLMQTLVLGVVTVIGALALVWVTTNSVIRPVQVLTDSALRMAGGDLTTPLEISSGGWFSASSDLTGRRARRDEIGTLANSFEAMRKQLKRSLDETQALNRDLDRHVQERTEALSRRNEQLSILNAVAMTVNQSLRLEDILERSLEEVLKLTVVDVGAVFLRQDLQGSLKLMAYQGLSEEAARLVAEMGMLDSSCGGVVERGQIVIVPDISLFHGRRARSLQNENLCTLVHVPLMAKGFVLGSMCVGTHVLWDFSDEEQELLTAIGSQIAVAIENARLYAEVQQKERLRGELFKKAINAQEEERKRIARELHDETSQSLTALLYATEEGLEMNRLKEVRKRLEGMHDLTQHTLDGVHKIIFDLRPSMLDHLGLMPAVRWLSKSRLEARGVRVTMTELGDLRRLPPEMETALFRVMQEAIVNIARHAAARNVRITYSLIGDEVRILVEDDGIGFDLRDLVLAPDSPRGLGLIGMQERLELLGGEIEIRTIPGSGTQVLISVPLVGEDCDDD
jgi:signal transduction histidine kinase